MSDAPDIVFRPLLILVSVISIILIATGLIAVFSKIGGENVKNQPFDEDPTEPRYEPYDSGTQARQPQQPQPQQEMQQAPQAMQPQGGEPREERRSPSENRLLEEKLLQQQQPPANSPNAPIQGRPVPNM
jgi:hypothetical protein